MSVAVIEPEVPPKLERKSMLLQPAWPSAFWGLWSLTWRSQLSLRRLRLLMVTLSVIPLLTYLTVDDERIRPYLHWVIDFYLLLLLPLYCLSVCGGMIRDELQADTLGFLTTRPMTRAQFFLGKYVCQIVWLQILGAASGILLLAAGFGREIPGIAPFGALFLGTQFLGILSYGALSALLGLLNQRYMVLGIIYGFVVEMGIGRIPTNINNLSLSRHLRTLLANNDTVLNIYEWSPDKTFLSIIIMLAGALTFLVVGAVVFTFKEYHHTEEMQK
ncbi:MAG: hypothetical protein FJ403_15845 [Verrucomicrobia bacterium]|nr:hypothetical protein [Verrucomicrobiota bacterium]